MEMAAASTLSSITNGNLTDQEYKFRGMISMSGAIYSKHAVAMLQFRDSLKSEIDSSKSSASFSSETV